jgi:hypothetical protein
LNASRPEYQSQKIEAEIQISAENIKAAYSDCGSIDWK